METKMTLGKKDMVVRAKYPDAGIHYLVARKILTKGEKVGDNNAT